MNIVVKTLTALAAAAALAAGAAAQDASGDPTLRLGIGDPRYKDKTLDVVPGVFVSA